MDPIPPAAPTTEMELENLLSTPSQDLIQSARNWTDPLVIVGAAGKMGPTLCRMAQQAAEAAGKTLRIVAASRFSNPSTRAWLNSHGIETQVCDVLDRNAVAQLPDSAQVIYLIGMKFGTRETPGLTWALNTLAPANFLERYPQSHIVALSTGNVYPMCRVNDGGADESTPRTPVGEYPNAAVARERIFEFLASQCTAKITLLRLNYAAELRYGILVDIALRVWNRQPIDLTCGWFNCIWQGDANDRILQSLGLSANPPSVWNLTGPETLSVRRTAEQFGQLLNRPVEFRNQEAPTALLSNSRRLYEKLPAPTIPPDRMIQWIASWILQGGQIWNRPTHYAVRDGVY